MKFRKNSIQGTATLICKSHFGVVIVAQAARQRDLSTHCRAALITLKQNETELTWNSVSLTVAWKRNGTSTQ